MKLSTDEVKEIIRKVYLDLSLSHSSKYPIECTFCDKNSDVTVPIDHWIGAYDYRDPEAVGDEWYGEYPDYNIIVDDVKGEAIIYSHYTGHFEIKLNVEGRYEIVKQLYREIKE